MEQSGDGVGEAAKEAQPVGLTRKRSAACRRPRADPLDLDALVAPAPVRGRSVASPSLRVSPT